MDVVWETLMTHILPYLGLSRKVASGAEASSKRNHKLGEVCGSTRFAGNFVRKNAVNKP